MFKPETTLVVYAFTRHPVKVVWLNEDGSIAGETTCDHQQPKSAQVETALSHIDCLMSDQLRRWAGNIEGFGSDLTHWTDPSWLASQLRLIATGIEQAIKVTGGGGKDGGVHRDGAADR